MAHLQAGLRARDEQRHRACRLRRPRGHPLALRVVQHRGQLGPLRQHQEPQDRRGELGLRLHERPHPRRDQHRRANRIRAEREHEHRLRGHRRERCHRGCEERRVLCRHRHPRGLHREDDDAPLGRSPDRDDRVLQQREGERHRVDRLRQGRHGRPHRRGVHLRTDRERGGRGCPLGDLGLPRRR